MKAFAIFLVGLVLTVVIILTNPIIFGEDTLNRLLHRNTLVIGHQLPMLQVLISAVTIISPDPILVRYMVAVIGALAGVGFYFVVKDLFGEKWAFPAALLFVTNPYFVALSTVPYQEILMLAALLFAFHLFYKERWLAASGVFAIACLSRYEAWAAAPVLAVAYVLRKDRSVGGWLKGVLLFGWMPALWILVHGGLSSPTHVVVEPSFSIRRLERWVHIAWVAVRNTQLPVLVLAVVGAWRLYRDRSLIDWRLRVQGAFVGLFLLAIPFSAHGVPPNPERYVTSREAVILIYFVLLVAAVGLALWPRLTSAIVALGVILGAAGAYRSVWRENHQPEMQLAYRLAKYLDSSVHDGQRAIVLVKPFPEDLAQSYLRNVRERKGEQAWRQAQLEVDEARSEPTDYQRVLVHSRLSRDRLLSSATGCAEWVGVWSDYPDAAREIAIGQQVEVLRSGAMSVTVLQRPCGNK